MLRKIMLIRFFCAAAVLVRGYLWGFAAQQPRPAAIFTINTNEFWLKLHHFLYVLGQSEGRSSASLREAMRDAPADAERVWPKQLSGSSLPAQRLKPFLEEIWKPYLNGRGTREEALGLLVARADAVSR